jgi:hypothetical protein
MNPDPWSAKREAQLRLQYRVWWLACWSAFVLGCVFVMAGMLDHSWRMLAAAVLSWVLALVAAVLMFSAHERLGTEMAATPSGFYPGSGMLRNKPRSVAHLTLWLWHTGPYDPRERLTCTCGLSYFWCDAQLVNPVQEHDADDVPKLKISEIKGPVAVSAIAERYVLLCRCGTGHYKLRTEK